MCRWFAILVVVMVLAAPAASQTKTALDVVPDDALGFLAIHDLSKFSKKVEELAKKVNAPAHVSLLELVQNQGIRKGLNEEGMNVGKRAPLEHPCTRNPGIPRLWR